MWVSLFAVALSVAWGYAAGTYVRDLGGVELLNVLLPHEVGAIAQA